MFPFNLDHQAGVMYAIHTFVDVCLNLDLSDEDFIFDLERLYCAFEAFKQEGIEYAASIRAFIAVTEYVNSQRGMLSFGEYLSGRSVGGISNISSCMGFNDNSPCPSVLLDKTKLPIIKRLKDLLTLQIHETASDSPFFKSLQVQLESAERAIHVIENN